MFCVSIQCQWGLMSMGSHLKGKGLKGTKWMWLPLGHVSRLDPTSPPYPTYPLGFPCSLKKRRKKRELSLASAFVFIQGYFGTFTNTQAGFLFKGSFDISPRRVTWRCIPRALQAPECRERAARKHAHSKVIEHAMIPIMPSQKDTAQTL